MPEDNRPLSEIYKEAGDDWVEKDAIARMREDTKSLRFAQRCQALGEMPVNRAEQTVKADPDWYKEVIEDVTSRTAANKSRVYLESVKMRSSEEMSENANHRAEMRI